MLVMQITQTQRSPMLTWQIWQIWQDFVRFAKLLESDIYLIICHKKHYSRPKYLTFSLAETIIIIIVMEMFTAVQRFWQIWQDFVRFAKQLESDILFLITCHK